MTSWLDIECWKEKGAKRFRNDGMNIFSQRWNLVLNPHTSNQQHGAEEARRAHNPEDRMSTI
jgi:hypothetical protein